MAEKRMFTKTIIDSDAFLDMPLSTQCLYFHLSMRADDDGFINNPKKLQRMIGCADDDLKLLIAKRFIIPFESGVVVIKHWKMHNYIQKDRYKETVYLKEKELLTIKDNKAYTLKNAEENLLDTECIQDEYGSLPQVRLDKIRLDKNIYSALDIYNHWNKFKIIEHKKLTDKMKTVLNSALKDYAAEDIKTAISNYSEILADKKYYFKYKWTLIDFLKRGLEKFLDLETAKNNYIANKKAETTPKPNKFHNCDSKIKNYTESELEGMLKDKWKKDK